MKNEIYIKNIKYKIIYFIIQYKIYVYSFFFIIFLLTNPPYTHIIQNLYVCMLHNWNTFLCFMRTIIPHTTFTSLLKMGKNHFSNKKTVLKFSFLREEKVFLTTYLREYKTTPPSSWVAFRENFFFIFSLIFANSRNKYIYTLLYTIIFSCC